MLDVKMKETCRVCGRDLCGNQRRWIFHPTAKLNLQVLLSHALGQELTRDGRGEFACSKCTFMLDRMYRFDTVIARVEALSLERLQRLLQEKHRLRQCIGGLYRKTNAEGPGVTSAELSEEAGDGMVDISGLTHAKYCALLQEDLVYSLYESWADDSSDCQHQHHPPGSEVTAAGAQRWAPSTPRRCRGCSHWRVADCDYEAVCKVPRKLARSISCGPSTRYSASLPGGDGGGDESDEPPSSLTLVPGSHHRTGTSDSDRTLAGRASSSPSVGSLDTAEVYVEPPPEEEAGGACGPSLSLALCVLQTCAVHRPVRSSKGSRLPVLRGRGCGGGGPRLAFPDPMMGMSCGSPEGELETPEIRLEAQENQGVSVGDLEDSLEELYREYPPPPPHQVHPSSGAL